MTQCLFLTRDEILDRLLAMRKQEETGYCYRNYLPPINRGNGEKHLNVAWREKICQWSYNVVDHFELSREVVAVSLNMFDRYLATRGNKCNGNLALLASLTTLHMAIKLNESKKVKLRTLANLSRGQFGPRHIEQMEWEILSALGWRLHPPTHFSFVAHLMALFPHETNAVVRKDIFELSRYLTELAICDSYFVDVNNSTVAFAAILSVLDDLSYARLPAGIREKFLRDVRQNLGLWHNKQEVLDARERLKAMFDVSTNREPRPELAALPSAQGTTEDESLAGSSMGSNGSHSRNKAGGFESRPRANSSDSKSSCRYSPSPIRRLVPGMSPMGPGRAHLSSSPMVAGVQ